MAGGTSTPGESVTSRALALLDGPALALRHRLIELLDRLPDLDARALHGLGESLGDERACTAFLDTVNAWLTAQLARSPQDLRRLGRVARIWEDVNRTAQEVDEFNLDRRPMAFAVFDLLAEAARG